LLVQENDQIADIQRMAVVSIIHLEQSLAEIRVVDMDNFLLLS
jgi:hypothetical protein